MATDPPRLPHRASSAGGRGMDAPRLVEPADLETGSRPQPRWTRTQRALTTRAFSPVGSYAPKGR
jgi:hypothetical protein